MFYFNFSDISNFISGTAQPKLNQQKLNSIEIPTPKNEEDLKYFVNKFQQIHLICSNYNQNINTSSEMYSNLIKSVLKKEFSYE